MLRNVLLAAVIAVLFVFCAGCSGQSEETAPPTAPPTTTTAPPTPARGGGPPKPEPAGGLGANPSYDASSAPKPGGQ